MVIFDKSQQLRAANFVKDTYTRKKQARQMRERRWKELEDIYRGNTTKRTYVGRANLYDPEAFKAVETLVPRIYNGLFPGEHWFCVQGFERRDKRQAMLMERYEYAQTERIRYRPKMIPLLRQAAIWGTMIAKAPYRYEERPVMVRSIRKRTQFIRRGILKPIPKVTEEEIVEEKIIPVWDDPDLQLVDIYDFIPWDDFIPDIQEQFGVFHRFDTDFESILRQQYHPDERTGIYENLDALWQAAQRRRRPVTDKIKQERMRAMGLQQAPANSQSMPIEGIEYQGLYRRRDNETGQTHLREMIITIAENEVVIRAEDNPYDHRQKTFLKAPWIEIPGEFWGMGVIEPIREQQYELNDRTNQTFDAVSIIVNPMWLKLDAEIKGGQINVYPGKVFNATTKDGLIPLRAPAEVLVPAIAAIQALKSTIQDVTGATRFLGGSAALPELQRTATGLVSIIREANAKLRLVITGIEKNFVEPSLKLFWQYNQQFVKKPRYIEILGKAGLEIESVLPSRIATSPDFRALGAQSIGSEEVKNQQLQGFLNVIGRIQGMDKLVFLTIRKIWEGFGFSDTQEIDDIMAQIGQDKQKDGSDAMRENLAMAQGVQVPVDPHDNHEVHFEIHSGFEQDPRFQQLPPETQQLVAQHKEQHQLHQKQSKAVSMDTGDNGTPVGPGSSSGPIEGGRGVSPQEQPDARRATLEDQFRRQRGREAGGGPQ